MSETPSMSTPTPWSQEGQLVALRAKNDKLVGALERARATIEELREQIAQLADPPGSYGVFVQQADERSVDVSVAGRMMRLGVGPEVTPGDLVPGQTVALNEAMTVVRGGGFNPIGDVAAVKDTLGDGRAVVILGSQDERVIRLAEPLLRAGGVRAGDTVICDVRSGFAFEVIPREGVGELVLEEVPDVTYQDIGGLGPQIETIRDAVELPFHHPELYREHGLRPPKGILLYGPPGCGKTLIAKAVARSLAVAAAGESEPTSYFLNIKGPELLNKYVGETERYIRAIFDQARQKASAGTPVVVFFDEMDSLFRTRGSGVSSDVETTIVPQLLAELDGVEQLDNVIVIGASNREDMIDPAILRPGRLDVKVKIERPDADGAREIFAKHLTADLPLADDEVAAHGGDRAATAAALIDAAVDRLYAVTPDNAFVEVTYASGVRETLYVKDFVSGAMVRNIVDRAKKGAIKDLLATGRRGLRTAHLLAACAAEVRENEDLPGGSNPDDWARVSGRKGERIVFLRTLGSGSEEIDPAAR